MEGNTYESHFGQKHKNIPTNDERRREHERERKISTTRAVYITFASSSESEARVLSILAKYPNEYVFVARTWNKTSFTFYEFKSVHSLYLWAFRVLVECGPRQRSIET